MKNFHISNHWDFGDDAELADRLKQLVLTGKKVATTGLYLPDEKHSAVGEFDEILGVDGKPFCIIRNIKVVVKPFLEVDFEHAKLEGEGDENIEEWRQKHRNFFLKYHPGFSDKSLVVCAEFNLIKIL